MVDNQHISVFDRILEQRIGYGSYQIKAFYCLALVDLIDGVDIISMSLILPLIQQQFSLTHFQTQMMSSIFYLGMIFGAFLTGKIADSKGRKNTIIHSGILQCIVALCFGFVNNIYFIMVLRFLYGFCYGFSMPLSVSSITEIVPLQKRGKSIIFMNFFTSVGKLVAIFLAYICLHDLKSGNWRLLMILNGLLALFGPIFIYQYFLESPRFLISIGKFQEAFLILNQMGRINKGYTFQDLSLDEMEQLIDQRDDYFLNDETASIKSLFNQNMKSISIKIWIVWFSICFMEFGQYQILPFILGKQNQTFSSMFFAILGELPAVLLAVLIIDQKQFGRRKSLFYFLILVSMSNFIVYIQELQNLSGWLFFMRFCMKNCFSMLLPLTSELYPTNFRTLGYGFATAFGRIGAFTSAFIVFPLFYLQSFLPFFGFFIIILSAAIITYTIPFDTTLQYLDQKQIPILFQNKKSQIELKLLKQ